jgi:drug/metabolite transporter (DMT)-like permease
MIAAFIPLTIYAMLVEGNPLAIRWTTTAVTSVIYLALLGSVVAAWLNYWLLSRVGAVNLLVMGLVEPIIAIMLGAWFLNESMHGRAIVGGAVILFSVVLTMKQEK